MSWLFSAALVAEYSAANCSDGKHSARSRSSLSVVNDLPSDKTKGFFRPFQSGAETLPLSTGDPGAELLTWFREASHVRTSARPTPMPLVLPVSVLVSGVKCS